MKGIFNLRPPKPKYSTTGDVKIVFDHFQNTPNNLNLDDEKLTQKLLMLLLLLSGQRLSTIHHFQTDSMMLSETSCTFAPTKVLKHSRPGRKLDTFSYEYLKRRETRVSGNTSGLFITYGQPYKEASQDSMSCWIRELFAESHLATAQ
eukprot:gene13243-14603_t